MTTAFAPLPLDLRAETAPPMPHRRIAALKRLVARFERDAADAAKDAEQRAGGVYGSQRLGMATAFAEAAQALRDEIRAMTRARTRGR